MAAKNVPPYSPIQAEFLGEQKIPHCSELEEMSYWRCNLVAASKHHNYLFLALCAEIHVYIPTYPRQTLPAVPHAILKSLQAVPSVGYIDPQCPHAINTLTIGELGEEEVLVSAHDDGDVCVWYTRDLSRMALRENVGESAWGVAIHKEKRLLAVSANTHDITVFELGVGRCGIREEEDEEKEREVGKDVLARRMEAVPPESSCHGETRKRMAGDEAGRVCGRPRASSAVNGHKRRKEKKAARKDKSVKVLKGHSHNIPSISFLDDSSGRWLAGTSIDGVVILWDVHTQRMVEKCHFDIRAKGWSVVLLTPQAFKTTRDIYEALGKSSNQTRRSNSHNQFPYAEVHDDGPPRIHVQGVRSMATDYYDAPAAPRNRSNEAQAWDISPAPAVGYASNRNNMFFQGEEYSEDEDDDEDSESAFGEFIDEPDGAVVGTIPITLPQLPIPIPTVPTPVPGSPDSGGDEDGGSETSSDGELYQFDQDLDSNFEGGFYEDAASVPGIGSDDDFSDNSDDQELDDEINDLGLEESAPDTSHTHGNGQEIDSSVASIAAAQAPRVQQSPVEIGHQRDDAEDTAPTSEDEDEDHEGDQEEEAEPAQPPTSFIFATTERDAYLLPTSLLSPTVVCQNFLGQPYPHTGPPYLVHVDRLNMVLPIPELSLVVAASQKGRVGIFRLTRSGKQFGMRLDTVLPREQGAPDVREADLDVETRPKAHLLGIAVSPVQGKEMGKSRAGSDSTDCGRRKKERQRGGGWRGVEGRRRWRLVIVYADGSILSYELGREREEEGQGGLGDLFGMAGFAMV